MNEELAKAVAALREPWLITENRASVVVYRDDLTAVLDRLEELESAVTAPDTTSELEVGDKVVVLIDAMGVSEGTEGILVEIRSKGFGYDEYPFAVKVPFKSYPIGFERKELGKVAD